MPIPATQLKVGMHIVHNGELHRVTSVRHVTPGNWRGMVQTKLLRVKTGSQVEHRFRSVDTVDRAVLEQHELQYMYRSGDEFTFMNTESYEMYNLDTETLGDAAKYLQENMMIQANYHEGKVIGIDVSRTFAFSDGLSAGELEGMTEALGAKWKSRFKPAEALPLELIATRLPDEEVFFTELTKLVHQLIGRMFSNEVIKPGVTRTSDLVWWWRQQVNDLGLGTWFQPSIDVQRRGATPEQLGDDPVIQRGDVLHCDVGITAMRLNTDTQHDAYVLRDGETEAPAGLRKALASSNRFQDILMEEVRPGRTGNEVLKAVLAKLASERITGTMYSHPIGMHGHGAGPLIGLWDYQEGVPGRGDAKIIPSMWFSSELQTTTPVPEWGNQPVRMAQEEDFFVGADGKIRWAYQRQSELHIVK